MVRRTVYEKYTYSISDMHQFSDMDYGRFTSRAGVSRLWASLGILACVPSGAKRIGSRSVCSCCAGNFLCPGFLKSGDSGRGGWLAKRVEDQIDRAGACIVD